MNFRYLTARFGAAGRLLRSTAVVMPERAQASQDSPETAAAIAPQPAPTAGRGRLRLVVVGVLSMLTGAAAATGVLLASQPPEQPMYHYTVNVWLEQDTSADQKAAVQAALPAFHPIGEATFVDREKAWKDFQEMTKDKPELLRNAEMESMPEHFGLKTTGHVFDCTGYAAVRNLPGVDKIQVLQDLTNHYVADITCDAEYAVRRN